MIDLTNRDSMTKVEGLYDQIYEYHPKKDITIVTVGNKCDSEDRKINRDEAELLA